MIESPTLSGAGRIRHGFFTRDGGVSDGLFRSLNCGFGSGDSAAAVAENRILAMARLGVTPAAPMALVTCHQVHSARAVTVAESWSAGAAPHADAMVTRRPGIALGVLTADCAPVLLADHEAGIIGAAHAGWRGALAGVIEATVAAMARLGATPGGIRAVVGPTIAQRSYEVGPEFPAPFLNQSAANGALFAESERSGHKLFDLAGYVASRLGPLGLAAVEVLDHDTYSQETRFFSYRRSTHEGQAEYGRGLSAIALAP
ncbi:MAG: peptidoglycan editing factor PgeF [Alphaproteobacteria bacterium]|jgi:hypothetical protein|nr:peptidoglycan editing factor PgeF [Alphaproteobacteria bacterium]MDP6518030.1 peptidoglycan editing factor PgeF [Alphaproteobacteria bacterium]